MKWMPRKTIMLAATCAGGGQISDLKFDYAPFNPLSLNDVDSAPSTNR